MLRGIQTRTVAAAAMIIVAVVTTGCDKVPLTAPTNSTISLTAPTRSLPLGGTTELTAVVTESGGTPVQNGTTVRFTTSLGSVNPVEAQTRNGVATATFNAGDVSGTAQIHASSGGISSGSTTSGTTTTSGSSTALEIAVGGAAANSVTLTATPSNVPAAGGTVTLTAAVLDASGNRLVGIPVSFSTTAGSLSASVVNTDSSGEARVQLTTTVTATVTATVRDKTATATINVAAANSMTLSTSPTTPIVDQPVTLSVTLSVGANNTPPRVVVDWGDGTQTDLGTVGSTGTTGRTVTHTYTRPGSYVITATATAPGGEITIASIGVTIAPKPVLGVNVAASSGTPRVNTPVTFTATVTGDTNAVISSYVWQFLDSNGNQDATTTTTGNAVTRVFTSTGPKTIIVTVNTADGRSGTGQTQIVVQP